MLDNKKIKEMSQMMQDINDSVIKNPPKEVRLIEAMKPFFAEERHKSFDDTIEMLNQIHAIKKISGKIASPQIPAFTVQGIPANATIQDESIHNDGIYDMDDICINKKFKASPQLNMMFMTMALMGKI